MGALNLTIIRKSVDDMPIAKDVLTLYKDRQRGRQDSTVPRIMRLLGEEGKKYKRDDLLKWMGLMEQAGAGRLVYSKNKPPRFFWTYNLKSIAEAALSPVPKRRVYKQAPPRTSLPDVPGTVIVPVAPAETPVSPEAKPAEQAAKPAIEVESTTMNVGAMVIRNNRSGFEVTLPLDLTPSQAKIAQALLSGLTP